MFQFAAGKALATRLGVELVLDTSFYQRRRKTGRAFGLDHFAHGAREIDTKGHFGSTIWAAVKNKFGHQGIKTFREESKTYDPDFDHLSDNIHLKGYWQSEKYFQSQASEVRRSLTFANPPSPENATYLDEIENCQAVSLHIRRGDYVSNSKFNSVHGLCDLNYYRKAVDHMANHLTSEPVFFAFSDDPDWVSENLKLPFEVRYLRHNAEQADFEDLRLMSACRHHILANSSFSWWGAWLNAREEKITIAPKQWFQDPTMQQNDIIVPSWITL